MPFSSVDDDSETAFLSGGGEMGARLREKDWAATPLGSADDWPQSLKTAVRIMLTSRQPMFVWWGRQLINLYNDAYKSIIGGKHPEALGQPAWQVWWEIWDQVGPRAESALRENIGTYDEALRLIMERNGYPEETYYTFSYSPIPNDDGTAGGILCANTDATHRIIGQRQLALLQNLASSLTEARNFEQVCARAAACFESNPRDIVFALIYRVDAERRTATLAAREGIDEGHPAALECIALDDATSWPVGAAVHSKSLQMVTQLGQRFENLPQGAWDRPPHQAAVVPIFPSGQFGKAAVLIIGLNPFRLFDEDYRQFVEFTASQISVGFSNAEAYENERRRAESLAELDRAKTTFFSNVSHEFRTPLTLMLGPLEDLLSHESELDSAGGREMLGLVHRSGRRLLKLVNTLLDFSRIEAGRVQATFQPVKLAEWTAELASVFRSMIEQAGMRLVIDCPPLPEDVYVDRDMWEKIVLNLLSNAFKYTHEGEIEVCMRAENGSAVLSVRDTGIGIQPEELPKLFNRFHRVEGAKGRTQEGTGIGLALVQELARLHRGTVHASSEYGKGSTFTVSIPFGKEHLPAERIDATRNHERDGSAAEHFVEEAQRWLPSGESIFDELALPFVTGNSGILLRSRPLERQRARVVLADDNADMREYVRKLLAEEYEVIAVPDGRSALVAVLNQRPDLVLTDVMMPQLDGFGLLRAIRSDPQTASVPVILVSARAGEEARVEGLQAGADDYLTKPFSARELLARVASTIKLARVRRDAALREQQLREQAEAAEDRTHRILDSIADGFVAVDPQWRYTYVNAEAERLIGRSRSRLIGSSAWDLFPKLVNTPLYHTLQQSMLQRTPADIEFFNPRIRRWFENRVYPGDDGGLTIYFRDITERKLADQALRDSDERMRLATRTGKVGIWDWDIAANRVVWTESMYGIYGLKPEEFDGTRESWAQRLHPDDRPRVLDALERSVQRGEPYEIEFRAIRPDGELIWLFSNANVLTDGQRTIRMLGATLDITARKQAEAALQDVEQRFARFMQHLPGLAWIKDVTGRYLFVNEAAARAFGASCDEIVGKTDDDLFPAETAASFKSNDRRALDSEAGIQTVEQLVHPGGQLRYSLVSKFPIPGPQGRPPLVAGMAIDITDRLQAENELRDADRRKDEFLATLAHELRNPLAPLRNGLEMMRLGRDDLKTIELARGMMERQVEQMVHLIDDLLDVSRISRGKIDLHKTRVDLRSIIRSAVETSQPLLRSARHELIVQLPPQPYFIEADPLRLAQVFSNLLNNAAKYTPPGGKVRLTVDRQGDEYVINVEDNGIGIPGPMLSQIFDLFTQVDHSLEKSQGGLGVGLTIVKRLVEMHGGSVSAHSDGPDTGSRFTVRLPAAENDAASTQSPEPKTTAGRPQTRRILVVDDNQDSALTLAMLLKIMGHETETAQDGVEAVEAAERFRPELIIMDIGMPRMNGLDACRSIREQPWGKKITMVALTGWGQEQDQQRTRDAGFDLHLVKPVQPAELTQILGAASALADRNAE